MLFHVLNWFAADVEVEDTSSADDESPHDPETYFIKLFGVDALGQSVSVTVCDFEPHFYVKLDRPWSLRQIESFVDALRCRMPKKWNQATIKAKALSKKDFWGFSNGKHFPFLRLAFKSERAMRAAARALAKPIAGLPQRSFKLYESNISPMLRFAHIRDLPSVGWLRVTNEKRNEVLPSRCKTDVQANWKCIEPVRDRDDIAPFVIAAFDIECNSSDGDFPVAQKTYQKVANDLYNLNNLHAPAEFAKRAAALVRGAFASGAIVPFRHTSLDGIEDTMYQIAEHIRVLANGDVSQLKLAMRDRFLEAFEKGGLEVFEQCVAFYDKISASTTSSAALRRAVHTWLKKCFASREAQLTWAAKGNQEDIVEDLVRYLLKDKDAVVSTLARYLDGTLPRLKGDEIIQIGTTFHRYGDTDVSRRVLFSLGACGEVADTEIVVCGSEAELITKWCDLIQQMDPDVVTGYNILGFDFAYIYERGLELGCAEEFDRLGRLLEFSTEFKESKLSSSALGDNILRYLDMHGRTIIDLMKVVQRDHKLDSYKLDAVASHFMKMNKHDVSPQQIFDLYKRGSAEDRALIADYCIQDCALCNKLVMKLEIIANNVGMAKVCSVPLSYIFMRGQGVKIFSLIAKECKAKGYLVPAISKVTDADAEEGYEGAIVLEPKTGIYIDTPVAVLDYASLYPSSMISENLSHDCLVLDKRYDNLEGIDYQDVSYDLYDINENGEKVKVGEKVCRYAQPKRGDESSRGILPTILVYLLKQRKLTRKRMEAKRVKLVDGGPDLVGFYKDGVVYDFAGAAMPVDPANIASIEDAYSTFEKATLDGLQLAYKVTANSLYGQMGAKTSPVYLKDIAACTTATGRKMILLAKDFLEREYKADIIYGDSVTGNTPILVRRPDGELEIVAIQDLAHDWHSIDDRSFVKTGDGKQQAFVEAQVFCNGEWAQITRVIRHKTAKAIFRVNAAHGTVDVTEDHSLIEADTMRYLSPGQVIVGETRLAGDLTSTSQASNRCYDRFFDLGVRFAEMSDAHRSGKAGLGRLKLVLNSCVATKSAFVDGFWDKSSGLVHTNDLLFAQYLYIVTKCVQRAGYQVFVRRDSFGTVTLERRLTLLPMNNVVGSVAQVANPGEYVYDLETAEGVFHGGVGEILLKNTDSLFVHFLDATANTTDALTKTIEMGKRASDAIKPMLKHPHDLEYEKTFWPFILFSKKRYVANQYGTDPTKFKQTSMGIVLKRRDNANIVKKIYGGIIDIILNKHDILASVDFLKESLGDLVQGKFPLEELIISKTLKAHYKDPSRIAHKVLADRIKERSPGSAPQVNDRIPYVYVYHENSKKLLQGDRIEHPDYIRERQLKPDYEFYITNQVMNPVLQLYAIVLEQLTGYSLPNDHWKRLEKQLIDEGRGPQQVRERIAALRESEVKRLLFDPVLKRIADDPERKRLINKSNGNRTITEWFKPV